MYKIFFFLSIMESLFEGDQCLFRGLLLPTRTLYHSANYYLLFRGFDFLLRGFARGITYPWRKLYLIERVVNF